MSGSADRLDLQAHDDIFHGVIVPESGLGKALSHGRPTAIILGGQPGAGKGRVARAAAAEFHDDLVLVDPDELRRYHPRTEEFRAANPFTWSGRTHEDASAWATQLREAAVRDKKNVLIDTTLGNAETGSKLVEELRSHGYDVEIRVVAAHRLESEHGVDRRFTDSTDEHGYGRYVPRTVRDEVYDGLPRNLDAIHHRTGARSRRYARAGQEL